MLRTLMNGRGNELIISPADGRKLNFFFSEKDWFSLNQGSHDSDGNSLASALKPRTECGEKLMKSQLKNLTLGENAL